MSFTRASNRSHWQHNDIVGFHLKNAATLSNQWGPLLPVLRALPLCTCCHHYPGAAAGCLLRSLPQPYQPSPKWRSGRPAQRPFRGLLSVHSVYGLHTRAATNSRHASPEASTTLLPPQLLRLLPAGAVAGWDSHPQESAALSRRTPRAVIVMSS